MDDDGAAELGLSVSRGPQHLCLALCDGPAGADLSDYTAADVCAVSAMKHLADDDVCELTGQDMRSRLKQDDITLTCVH